MIILGHAKFNLKNLKGMKQIEVLCLDVNYRIRVCDWNVMPQNEAQMQDLVFIGKVNNYKIP